MKCQMMNNPKMTPARPITTHMRPATTTEGRKRAMEQQMAYQPFKWSEPMSTAAISSPSILGTSPSSAIDVDHEDLTMRSPLTAFPPVPQSSSPVFKSRPVSMRPLPLALNPLPMSRGFGVSQSPVTSGFLRTGSSSGLSSIPSSSSTYMDISDEKNDFDMGEFDMPMNEDGARVVKLESKTLSSGVSTQSALYGDDALCLDDETDEIVDPRNDPAYTLAQMLVKGHEAGYPTDSLTMQIQVGLLR